MTLLEQASRLPDIEKLRLIEQLIAELDLPDPAVEAIWATEAKSRSRAVADGRLATRPLADALATFRR